MPGREAKRSWFIADPDSDDLLGLAGLLDRWVDQHSTPRAACAIVTAAATDDLRALHDRIPVALPRAAEARCHPQTVCGRLARFNAAGLDRRGDKPRVGRKQRLTEREWGAVLARQSPTGRLLP